MQTSAEREDVRIQRTRRLLQQALFDLTIEKGFASITVRDIAKRAMVNRSTFYRHYVDKYDLLNQYFDKLQEEIAVAAAEAEHANQTSPERVPSGLLVLITHVQEYAGFYRIMLGQKGDQAFIRRFQQLSETRYRYVFARRNADSHPHAMPIDMKLQYISHAVIGTLAWWLDNDQPTTVEDLAIWLGQLNVTIAGLGYYAKARSK